MQKLKTIIVDDESHGRSNLSILIKQCCPELEVVAEAASAIEARNMVTAIKPDVMFLDIHMPEYDGFDLLSWIENRQFAVVFVTAFPHYGIEALKTGAVDYILKPIIIAELQKAVGRILEWHTRNIPIVPSTKDKIILSDTNGFILSTLTNIIRLEADSNYTKVYFTDREPMMVTKTLKEFEINLVDTTFIRIHKSDIINILYIKQYSFEDGGMVMLADGTQLFVSRSRQAEFISTIKKYSISLG